MEPQNPDVAGSIGQARTVDLASLKALAHPLRVQILELLSRNGAQTASSLAESLGESSGATSYHLRQLAKHDLVREVEDKGTARERWWERPPGALSILTRELATDPASREAARLVGREFERSRSAELADFMDHGFDELPPEWSDAASIMTAHLHLTVEELQELSTNLEKMLTEFADRYRNRDKPLQSRSVQLHLNAFPLIDHPRKTADTA